MPTLCQFAVDLSQTWQHRFEGKSQTSISRLQIYSLNTKVMKLSELKAFVRSIMTVLCELKILSLGITVQHHLGSLMMPNSYPCDRILWATPCENIS